MSTSLREKSLDFELSLEPNSVIPASFPEESNTAEGV